MRRKILLDRKRFSALLLTVAILSMPSFLALLPAAHAQQYPVPKEETVVVETDTSYTVLDMANPFIPSGTQWGSGWHQVVEEWDWYNNYATGEVIYWRITGWDYSADYKTFTLHIREGVTWNDGQPFTAHDHAFTLNLLKDNAALFGAAFVTEWIESVEVPDDYTLVIHLTKPNPRFHQWDRMWAGNQGQIVAEHVWKDEDPETFKNWPPVETGPYKLKQVLPELNMFVWERREDYWAKAVHGKFPGPKYVIYRKAPPADLDLEDFVAGMVDAPLPHVFTWAMIETASARTADVAIAPYMDPCPIGVPGMNLDVYPLNVREVRWAIANLVNREKIALIYPMAEKSEPNVVPFAAWGMYDKYRYADILEDYKLEFSPVKAIQLLDNAGFKLDNGVRRTPEGDPLSFEILSRPPPDPENLIAVDLAEELKKIGVDASVRVVDPGQYGDFVALGDYEIAAGSLCGEWASGDLFETLNLFHSKWYVPVGERALGGGLHGVNPRYKNTAYDAIVDQLSALNPDDPAADALYHDALEILMRDLPFIPGVEKMFVQTFSTAHFTGWPTAANMYHVPYQWWPEFIFVLFEIQPKGVPTPTTVVTTATRPTTVVTTALTTVVTTAAAPDMTMVYAGAAIVAIIAIALGFFVGRRRKS